MQAHTPLILLLTGIHTACVSADAQLFDIRIAHTCTQRLDERPKQLPRKQRVWIAQTAVDSVGRKHTERISVLERHRWYFNRTHYVFWAMKEQKVFLWCKYIQFTI